MKSKRWDVAQQYEKGYWSQIAEKIAADAGNQLAWYKWKASYFEKNLAHVLSRLKKRNVESLKSAVAPLGLFHI